MDRGPARPLKGIGRALVFRANGTARRQPSDGFRRSGAAEGAGNSRQAGYSPPSPGRRWFLSVIPFKNRRFLPFPALRRGDDFGMVPPIWGRPLGREGLLFMRLPRLRGRRGATPAS